MARVTGVQWLSASWCAPCKVRLPKVRALCEELGLPLEVLSVDNPADAQKVPRDILGVPTAIIHVEGGGTLRVHDATPGQLKGMLTDA